MPARWITGTRTLLLIAAVAVLLCVRWQWSQFGSGVRNLRFDSAAWKRADPIEGFRTVRSAMVDDLMRRGILDGMLRSEVEQFLGAPVADLRQVGVDAVRWHMAYYLGMERSGAFSLDDELLVIRCDEHGRVAEYATVVN